MRIRTLLLSGILAMAMIALAFGVPRARAEEEKSATMALATGWGNESVSLKVQLQDDESGSAVSSICLGEKLKLTATAGGLDPGESVVLTIYSDNTSIASKKSHELVKENHNPGDPGTYTFKAKGVFSRAGESDKEIWSNEVEVLVVQVSLEQVVTEGWLLDSGMLCLNAQDKYKKAKWKATVLPEGTTATIELHGDSEADVGVPSSAVENNQEFDVTAGGNVGMYKLLIKHSDHQVCAKESEEGVAFRLKFTVEDVDKTQETAGEGFINVNINSVSARSHAAGVTNGAYLAVKKDVKIMAEPEGAFAGKVESAFKLSLATSPTSQVIQRVDLGTDGSPVGFNFKFITVNLPNSRCAAALRGSIIIDDKAPILTSQVEFSNAALMYLVPDEKEQSIPVSASRSTDDLLIFTVGMSAVPVTFELAASSRTDNSNLKVTSNVAAGTTMEVALDDDNEYKIVP